MPKAALETLTAFTQCLYGAYDLSICLQCVHLQKLAPGWERVDLSEQLITRGKMRAPSKAPSVFTLTCGLCAPWPRAPQPY